ncbi:DMT family transporter [Dongia sedimenti]|uniref:DMT family transporter n=1 Tax=Dongia sedimenti TaxID=3064282 RepID=A0ABU0YP99_9PROT|nr:DMT family transporter [Rhodospirillaceae bacterium R-7]
MSRPGSALAARSMSGSDWLLLILLSVVWGGSFFFAKVAVAELPPLTIVLARVVIAAAALHLLVIATGRRMPVEPLLWRDFLLMGLLNNAIPFSLIFWGQQAIASGLASILNATTPLFTVLVAHAFTRDERATPAKLIGVGLGLAGVALMLGLDLAAGLGTHLLSELAVLAAALSYAFAGVFGRRFRGRPPLVVAAGQLTGSSVLILPLALLIDRPWLGANPSLGVWAALIGLALLSTALAYVIFFRILARAGATNLLLVTFLIPVSALLLGVAFLAEAVSAHQLLGMALIGCGLAVIDGRPWRMLRAAT